MFGFLIHVALIIAVSVLSVKLWYLKKKTAEGFDLVAEDEEDWTDDFQSLGERVSKTEKDLNKAAKVAFIQSVLARILKNRIQALEGKNLSERVALLEGLAEALLESGEDETQPAQGTEEVPNVPFVYTIDNRESPSDPLPEDAYPDVQNMRQFTMTGRLTPVDGTSEQSNYAAERAVEVTEDDRWNGGLVVDPVTRDVEVFFGDGSGHRG